MTEHLKVLILKAKALYYLCSENKAADQLRSYRTVDLCLCFSHMQTAGFPMMQLILYYFELLYNNSNDLGFAPSKDSDQLGHPPRLIRVLAVYSLVSS